MSGSSTAVASSLQMASSSSQQSQRLECPFCQFYDESEYTLLLHIEALHTDDSPFVVKDDPANTGLTGGFTNSINNLGPGKFNALDFEFRSSARSNEGAMYVLCPEPGCEEPVLLMELQTHLDFHDAEQISMDDVSHAGEERNANGGSSENSSGGSSGNSPLEGSEGHGGGYYRQLDSVDKERERSGKESRSEREGGGVRREKKENRTLMISRDGALSRELLAVKDEHRGKDRDGQRERDRMLEKEREKEREKAREKDRGWSSRGRRMFYADHRPPPSTASVAPPRHLHSSPKPIYRFFHGVPVPDNDSSSSRKYEKSSDKSNAVIPHKDSRVKRLGKSDLGPYAHERQMPDWLREELENGGKVSVQTTIDRATGTLVREIYVSNETPGLLPVIASLCERNPNIARAWICHSGVKHVGKQIKGEGGFCGYRNIQMMISYIQAAFPRGSHPFEGRIPSILKLQDWIEEGWDKGINVNARLETGGIRGTRKYIGTSEAQTMFTSLGITCCPHPFNRSEGLQTQHRLLDFVENYFKASAPEGPLSPKVSRTHKPPMYFQHSGHSMTIVGIERTLDGMRNLLVFDPFFTPSAPMKNLIGARPHRGRLDSGMLLRAYRRRLNYLQKYKEFELIVLEV